MKSEKAHDIPWPKYLIEGHAQQKMEYDVGLDQMITVGEVGRWEGSPKIFIETVLCALCFVCNLLQY